MKQQTVLGIFAVAQIPVLNAWKVENQYWPINSDYDDIRKESPWWLIKTPMGLVQIGWRKRVISIDWEDTPIRRVITNDDTTKGETYVHAWTEEKAIEYLKELAR